MGFFFPGALDDWCWMCTFPLHGVDEALALNITHVIVSIQGLCSFYNDQSHLQEFN